MKKLIIILLIVLTGALTYYLLQKNIPMHDSITRQKTDFPIAIYEWRSLLVDAPGTKQYFAQLQKKGIKTVYLDITDLVYIAEITDLSEKDHKKSDYYKRLRNYIRIADTYGIRVVGLTGDKDWSEDNVYLSDLALAEVFAYNDSAKEKEKLRGIQFDIEPYNLENFAGNEQQILENYIAVVSSLRDQVKKRSLKDPRFSLSFALPYWFDGENDNIPQIIFKGKSAYPFYHVSDILSDLPQSSIFLMAYRNNPNGENGTIALTTKEFQYATHKRSTVKYVIVQETVNVEPAHITFYGMGQNKLFQSFEIIHKQWSNNPAFGGVAIHDAMGFEDMK